MALNLRNTEGKIWLNVASWTCVLENFINLDNHVLLGIAKFGKAAVAVMPRKYRADLKQYVEARRRAVMIRHDCRRRLPFADESVDHILCSHFLEHVYPQEAADILSDFRRVLKSGGSLHIIVPDLRVLVDTYIRDLNSGDTSAADTFLNESLLVRRTRGTWKYRLLELHGGFGLQHRYMYDQDSIRRCVSAAGFEVTENVETPSSTFRKGDGSVHVFARTRHKNHQTLNEP